MAKSTIIPHLPEFFAAYPDIGIELLFTDRQVDLVEGVDCVVRVGAVGNVGLVAKHIGAYSQITCAAPRYIEQHGEPTSLDELDQHFAIGYVLNNSGRVRNWEFAVNGEAHTFAMKHKIAVNDGDSYIAAGVAGLELIQGSSYTLDPLLKSGQLVEVLKDYPSHARIVSVLYAANRHQPRRVRVFIDWVAKLYSPSAHVSGERSRGRAGRRVRHRRDRFRARLHACPSDAANRIPPQRIAHSHARAGVRRSS